MTVELGDITLTHLTSIHVREQARLARHPVPGLEGDLSQVYGRPSVEVRFEGIFYGDSAAGDLDGLRSAYLRREPVDFFTAAVGEGYFTQVLISRLEVAQRAGYLDQFDYVCEVVEYVEPPEPAVTGDLGLDSIDTDLLGEAMAFVDDVQNALEEVSNLVDLIANAPSFGDPTSQLPQMLSAFTGLASSASATLTNTTNLLS